MGNTGTRHGRTCLRSNVARRLQDTRDVLAVHAFRATVERTRQGKPPNWSAEADRLVNLRHFFYRDQPGQRLYVPVPIRVAYGFSSHATDRTYFASLPTDIQQLRKPIEYADLTHLIQEMERQRVESRHEPDQRGIVLLSRSGSGKTVASVKAYFDTLFTATDDELENGASAALPGHLPVWVDASSHSVVHLPVAERLASTTSSRSRSRKALDILQRFANMRRKSLKTRWDVRSGNVMSSRRSGLSKS